MTQYMVKEIEGSAAALERESNFQANFGWKLHSFEPIGGSGYLLKFVVVFEREKN